MDFRTKYSEKLNIVSKSGNGKTPVYKVRLTKNGVREVIKAGEDNIYKKIQACADSVDINTILTKFTNTGDESILKTNPGAFMDITDMPTTMFEAINQINDSKAVFDKLPSEIKKKFDFDYEKFICQAGQLDWYKNLGLVKEEIKEKINVPDNIPKIDTIINEYEDNKKEVVTNE